MVVMVVMVVSYCLAQKRYTPLARLASSQHFENSHLDLLHTQTVAHSLLVLACSQSDWGKSNPGVTRKKIHYFLNSGLSFFYMVPER